MPLMQYRQYVVIDWGRELTIHSDCFVSNNPITWDIILAYYEKQGADWDRDSVTFVDKPEKIVL